MSSSIFENPTDKKKFFRDFWWLFRVPKYFKNFRVENFGSKKIILSISSHWENKKEKYVYFLRFELEKPTLNLFIIEFYFLLSIIIKNHFYMLSLSGRKKEEKNLRQKKQLRKILFLRILTWKSTSILFHSNYLIENNPFLCIS